MASYTYTVEHMAVQRQVYPVIDSFEMSWEADPKCVFLRETCETEFVFDGDDYEYFLAIDESCDRCDRITFKIDCPTGEIWMGWLNLNKGTFDAKSCTFSIKADTYDDYSTIFETWQTKYNILGGTTYTVYGGIGELQETLCFRNAVSLPPFQVDQPYECNVQTTVGYVAYKHTVTQDAPGIYSQQTWWARMFVDTISPPPTSGWVAVTGGWARPVNLGTTNLLQDPNPWSWEFEILNFDSDEEIKVYDNGVKLIDVFSSLNAPTIISNFLGINPDASNPNNAVYTEASGKMDKLLLYQITDITKYDADENATKADLTLKELLDWLGIFEVYWWMDGASMRIEHISYLSSSVVLDASADATGSYSYDDQFVKVEKFEWDRSPSIAFQADNIIYPDCSTEDAEITYKAKRLNTDLMHVKSDPAQVNKDGFFLMMYYEYDPGDGNKFYVSEENVNVPYNGTNLELNGHLSFRNLLKNYMNYNRPQKDAIIEGVSVVFQTAKQLKIEGKFKTLLCCSDLVTFNFSGLITGSHGDGKIKKATWNSKTEMIELELAQDQNC